VGYPAYAGCTEAGPYQADDEFDLDLSLSAEIGHGYRPPGGRIGHLPIFLSAPFPGAGETAVTLDDRGELWVVSHEETNTFKRTRMLIDNLRADFRENGKYLFV